MISKWRLTALAVALSFGAFSPAADSAVLRCDGCTYFQVKDRASAAGLGNHMVLDFQTGSLWQFLVEVDREATRVFGQPLPKLVEEVTVEPQDAADFREIASIWRDNGGSLKTNVEIGPGHPAYPGDALIGLSARDIAGSISNREFVGRSVANLRFTGIPARIFTSANTVILFAASYVADGLQLRVRLTFPDGSSAVYVIDANNTTQAQYELGSARDSEGNIVPDQSHAPGQPNRNSLAGTSMQFNNPQNAANWFQRAEQLGIPVTGRPIGNDPRPIIVECRTDADGVLQCRARYASR